MEHFICSSSARCTDARVISLLGGREDLQLGAHLACFPSLCWHACKAHSTGTLYLIFWKCVPHITCGFYLVTFQLLLFFKEGNYKAIIYNDHYTEGQKGMTGCHAVHLVVWHWSECVEPGWHMRFCPVHLHFLVCSLLYACCPPSRSNRSWRWFITGWNCSSKIL